MPDFTDQLTAARKAAGMTQEQLADAVHVARSTISSWEHGRTQPDLDMLRQLGKVLHFDFLNGEAAPQAEAEMPAEATSAKKRCTKRNILIGAAALAAMIAAATTIMMVRYTGIAVSVYFFCFLPILRCRSLAITSVASRQL